MRRLTVVLSGFGSYEGVAVNPSRRVVEEMERRGLPEVEGVRIDVHGVLLPVSFAKAWPVLCESIERFHPDIVVATGLKRRARAVELERCATNLMDASRPDADNMSPRSTPVRDEGPAAYWTRLPLRSILRDFAGEGIAATLSSDAGTFVCNSLFYQLLDWARFRGRVLAGFVSLPPVPEGEGAVAGSTAAGLPVDVQVQACVDVVARTVEYFLAEQDATGRD